MLRVKPGLHGKLGQTVIFGNRKIHFARGVDLGIIASFHIFIPYLHEEDPC